jgi:hypothetical protein
MRIAKMSGGQIELALSFDQLDTIKNCLNKVCGGFKVMDFKARIGLDEDVTSRLADEMVFALSGDQPSATACNTAIRIFVAILGSDCAARRNAAGVDRQRDVMASSARPAELGSGGAVEERRLDVAEVDRHARELVAAADQGIPAILWDALLEGNLARRRHAKFVPSGVARTFI